jgi:hypothetical protein
LALHTGGIARQLEAAEIDNVAGDGQVATGLALGAAGLGIAGVVTRFIPGAQVLSGGLTILSIGVGALAVAAARLDL